MKWAAAVFCALVVGWTGPAAAQVGLHRGAAPVRVTVAFHTVPEGAAVTLFQGPHRMRLGASGRPLELWLDPATRELYASFDLPGHVSRQVAFALDPSSRLRVDLRAVRLEPCSGWIALQDALISWRHPLQAAGGLALVFGLGYVLPRRLRARRDVMRALRLRVLLGDGGPDLMSGKRIGRWRLAKRLGGGGMATVYAGVPDDTLDEAEAVAVKMVDPDLARDAEFRRRFAREVDICRTLSHPNIVRLIEWGEQEAAVYLVIELMRGGTLRERLRPEGMPPEAAARCLLPVFHGLVFAHERGVVHRDLKPDNVMMTAGGTVKIMDFGLARTVTQQITRPGATLGTPGYMAPEQIRGEALDARSDQFALGVMAYQVLSGRMPVEGMDGPALMYRYLSAEPLPSLRDAWPEAPPRLAAVVDRMLSKAADDRYPTMADALHAFEEPEK